MEAQWDGRTVRRVAMGKRSIAALLCDTPGIMVAKELRRLASEPCVTCIAVALPAWALPHLIWARDSGPAPIGLLAPGWLLPFMPADPMTVATDLAIMTHTELACVDPDLIGLPRATVRGHALLGISSPGAALTDMYTPEPLRAKRGAHAAKALRSLGRRHDRIIWVGPGYLWEPIERALVGEAAPSTGTRTVARRPVCRVRLAPALAEEIWDTPAVIALAMRCRDPEDDDDEEPWRILREAVEMVRRGEPDDALVAMPRVHPAYEGVGEELRAAMVAQARADVARLDGLDDRPTHALALVAAEELQATMVASFGDPGMRVFPAILPELRPSAEGGFSLVHTPPADPDDAERAPDFIRVPQNRRKAPPEPHVVSAEPDDAWALEIFLLRAMEFASRYTAGDCADAEEWGDLLVPPRLNGRPAVGTVLVDFVDAAHADATNTIDIRARGDDDEVPDQDELWHEHPSFNMGAISRIWNKRLVIAGHPHTVTVTQRGVTFATLEQPCAGAQSRVMGFNRTCVLPLIHALFSGDRLEHWMRPWLEASAGKAVAYISPRAPDQAIASLADRYSVDLLHIPLDALPRDAVLRVATFRQIRARPSEVRRLWRRAQR